MIYILWEAICVLFSKAKINKRKALLFLIALLWILMSFRSLYMGINDTRGVYYNAFNRCQLISIANALKSNIFIREPLMTLYTWTCAQIMPYRMFLAISCLIPSLSFYFFIKDNCKNVMLGAITYFTFFYFYESFLIKQMIALSIILSAIKYLKKGKLFNFVLFVIVAGGFHKSAFIFIPMYFVCKCIRFNKWFFAFMCIGYSVGILCGPNLLNILYKLKLYNFEAYIRDGIYSLNGSINFSMILFPLLTFICYALLKSSNRLNENSDYLILMIVGCVINAWSVVVVEFYRLALYFMAPMCIILPEAADGTPKRYKRLFSLILISFLLVYALKNALNCNCLPYALFIFD